MTGRGYGRSMWALCCQQSSSKFVTVTHFVCVACVNTELPLYSSLSCFSFWVSAKPLELVTLDYPPYVVEQEGELSGVAIELVGSVFDELGVAVSIEVLPWARALSNVQFGRSDAIFLQPLRRLPVKKNLPITVNKCCLHKTSV
ncbi:transporter substrate-binding domain-containing protein [Vibrio sinaloensis]|nr:transporter substrate-binding domain-containing protein [Vibrio sinaloensis]